MAAPIVQSVAPIVVDVDGGTPIKITGQNFVNGAAVTIDATPASAVVFVSSTELWAIVPAGVPNYVASVTVTNPDTTSGTLPNAVTYKNSDEIDYNFTTEESPASPRAIIAPADQESVVGNAVRLDGRASFSPFGLGLTFSWSFSQVPIGSQVRKDGFIFLEDDQSVVSFTPDLTGIYEIQLVVNDGSFDSAPATSSVKVKVVLVPQDLGIVPDTSWVWNFLSDFWTRVEQRARFETFWAAAIQVIAAEQLKLWQYDYNKSIKDIQDLIQRRWLNYQPALALDLTKTSFILADDQAGITATTFVIDPVTNAPVSPQPLLSNVVSVPVSEGSFGISSFGKAISKGRLLSVGGRSFTLLRSGVLTRSVNYGIDGSTTNATDTFEGSAFQPAMVGMRLKILTGSLVGTVYGIIAVANSHSLTVQNLDGSGVSFPSSMTGLVYSIFPATPNFNSFFADRMRVPTGESGLSWRFSATLVSTEWDFEQEGVSPGDVLRVEIIRTDTQRSGVVNFQVVSVDRGRLGVVLNTDDLEEGVAAEGLSKEDQIALATALQIPGLMISTVDQSLVYTDQALSVRQTVSSGVFKRAYYETELDSEDSINVGPFSIVAHPLEVVRNSFVKVDDNIRSVPTLQEYVKQPDIVKRGGALFQVSENAFFPVSHRPYVLFENLDYILDDARSLSGLCNVTSGSDLVQVPFGDLIDRSVRPGDSFSVFDGIDTLELSVVALVDPETVRVRPIPTKTLASATYKVSRQVTGNFLRFVGGVFTKKNPAPARLWAEVSFFDNNDAVEANFGILVGVTREDLDKQGSTLPYRSSVAGLMYALTKGPTVSNLQLASQILLGLPFTQYAGVITQIDTAFKTRDDGSPLSGRILVSAQDSKGNPLGFTNIYFYPQGRQLPDPNNPGKWVPAFPDLSGLAINPVTGKEYAVGDTVNRFVALSKGTQVEDYINKEDWVQQLINQGDLAQLIQKYHSFRLIVNSDVTTSADTDLIAQFLREAKPIHTKLNLALFKSLEDELEIDDALFFRRPVNFHDNISMSLPSAMSLDPQNVDSSHLIMEGEMRQRLLSGEDLVTTQGSFVVSSAAGGFVTARPGESHDGSFILNGYILKILEGDNKGTYFINSVNTDQQITLRSTDYDDNAAFIFKTASGQPFVVYRPMPHPTTTPPAGDVARGTIISGSGLIANGSNVVVPSFGLQSPGVAVGDTLVFIIDNAVAPLYFFSAKYKIVDFSIAGPSITLDRPVTELSGTYTVNIYRESLLSQSFNHDPAETFINLSTTAGQQFGVFDGGGDLGVICLINPGDTIVVPDTSEELEVIDWDPATATVWFTPAAASTDTNDARIERRGRMPGTRLLFDMQDRMPSDFLDLTISRRAVVSGGDGPDLTTTAASDTVSTVSGVDFGTDLNIAPGDFLVVLEGDDSLVDIGYGLGIFPILEVSGTDLILTRPLTQTHAAPGILYGIQRRRPNER